MSVRDQNRVSAAIAAREMPQPIINAGGVRLDVRTECYAPQVHAREVGIDKQSVPIEFELVTVRAEISHAYAAAGCTFGIGDHQMRIRAESGTKSLRCKPEENEKTAHRTTNNANVTDVEAEAGSFPACEFLQFKSSLRHRLIRSS